MIPRPEYPDPQFERSEWINLNGVWEFEEDPTVSGEARGLAGAAHLAETITVPFCPESRLSGLGRRDFHNCVWYRRELTVPDAWRQGRVFLHFGAVDHTATVWLNGRQIGTHCGGYASFSLELTDFLQDGTNVLTVRALDDDRNPRWGHGKQSREYRSHRCYYTRVTGIWQTVWLEYTPRCYVEQICLVPDADNAALGFSAELRGGGTLQAVASYAGKPVGSLTLKAPHGGHVTGTMPLSECHLWEIGQGRLYDLELTYGEDHVRSYFGLRSQAFDGYRFLLNGRSVFQRLVLDQGYYPDGVYTAPDDAALKRDIELSMACGFNGARLHQKVFEPRFLYHCDRAGYLVWGEYGNWGMDYSDPAIIPPLLAEWTEILHRDRNHPSVIGWCPLNETWDYDGRRQNDDLLRTLYRQTRALDPTRPCIDTSGAYHVETDLYDLHDYIQNPEEFAGLYAAQLPERSVEKYLVRHKKGGLHQGPYRPGQPFWISEYGGIKWDGAAVSDAWGYGDAPKKGEEFLERYRGLTDILLDNPYMFGFCYTQLYDVEQETNGLYTYDRRAKFDPAVFRSVNSRTAAIEKEEEET